MSVKNKAIAENLSVWFQKNARSLPWRSHPEPYSVWLSEVMLQQTQVATVLPYFEKFMKAFPKVQDLAQASLDEVYVLWAGLGYYSRARNLHRGAIAIAERIQAGQSFPKNREEWLLIPGVGEYTAGAICSIAFQQREALVDGNVVRVLSRLYAIEKTDAKKTEIWAKAKALVNVPSVNPSALNQSLMELGALICRPKNPQCERCPVQKHCAGKKNPEKYPEPKKKVVWKKLQEHKWVLLCEGKVYLQKNKKGLWREGLWDYPNAGTLLPVLSARIKTEFTTKYVVTNHKIERKHTVLELKPKAASSFVKQGEWFSPERLPALPAPVKKALLKVQKLK